MVNSYPASPASILAQPIRSNGSTTAKVARRLRRYFVMSWAIALSSWSCMRLPAAPWVSSSAADKPMQVLFVGNSYVYGHDLPLLFAALSAAGNHPVKTAMVASGGWHLSQHVDSAKTLKHIQAQSWDVVVLQEHSVTPTHTSSRQKETIPAATQLAEAIRAQGANPLLFMTWGRQHGLPEENFADFTAMQRALETGYQEVGEAIQAPVAPVGLAWERALAADPDIQLWEADGSHPSLVGSYLAACVFYAVIHQESPVGLSYTASLPAAQASWLQHIAAQTVGHDSSGQALEAMAQALYW